MRYKRGSKYGAKRTDGFASKKEAQRFSELSLELLAGRISELETQPRYELVVNGQKIGRYTADFRYKDTASGKLIVEEVKGYRVRDYVLRVKLFRALFPELEFIET